MASKTPSADPATNTVAATTTPVADPTATTQTESESPNKAEAKSRFSAALNEAKAGAAALGDEAKLRANAYRDQAKSKSESMGGDAQNMATDLANQGKQKASQALVGLSRLVDENTPLLDEKLGAKYGDYARNASNSLQDTAATIDEKSLEELSEDAREAVRKSPATAVGLAALSGFLFARLFRK